MIKQLTPDIRDYELLDTGSGEKLERFGRYVVRRPEPQAIWRKSLDDREWLRADASFLRDSKSEERGEWKLRPEMPSRWSVEYRYKAMQLRMRLALTSFKHVGIFPEQAANWNFIYDSISELRERGIERPKVLNLFAYTGGATLAACAAGADTTHVDSVKQVVTWARENMEQSGLDGVRWIVEDATKFVEREVRRGNKYHGIILDPPAYGRGANGEKWVLEDDICTLWASRRCLHAQRCTRLLVFRRRSRWASCTSATVVRRRYPSAPTTALHDRATELCVGCGIYSGRFSRLVRSPLAVDTL